MVVYFFTVKKKDLKDRISTDRSSNNKEIKALLRIPKQKKANDRRV